MQPQDEKSIDELANFIDGREGKKKAPDVSTEVNYVPERVSHLTTSMMSMGAVVIDDNGVYELLDNNT